MFENQSALRTSRQYVSLCNDIVIAGFVCQLLLCMFAYKFIAVFGALIELPIFPKTQQIVNFYNENELAYLNTYLWLNMLFYAVFVSIFCTAAVIYTYRFGSRKSYFDNTKQFKSRFGKHHKLNYASPLVFCAGIFVCATFIFNDGIGRHELFSARNIPNAEIYGFVHIMINYVVSTLCFYIAILTFFGRYFQVPWRPKLDQNYR